MSWIAEVRLANWEVPQDIKNRFSTASFLAENRVVFNIKGNSYRLVVQVRYVNGIVKVENVMTHPEYDKLRLK
nr:type II toxin-antitoxin system HigB family toxin [Providencia rettgeri]